MRTIAVVAIAIVVLALVPVLAISGGVWADPPPSEVWVDDDACPGPGSGTPADPYCKIQDGIDAVASPGIVHAAAGTYPENITLRDGVEVLGAGADVTTIDGGGSGPVVKAAGVGAGTKLVGFTITNGNGSEGHGMLNDYASPTVTNCIFSSNSASGGGGMLNLWGSPTVTNCTFSGNSANVGGGMYNYASSPTVTNCIFSDNSAEWSGAMLSEYYSSPTVTNCIFSGNSAVIDGGAMYNGPDSVTVTNCTFSGNSAGRNGGAMLNYNNYSLTVTNCILWGNSEEIHNISSTPEVTYCDVQGGYPDGGNIKDADPLFVDPAGGDYHLQADSPCIDAGTNEGAPTEDIEGNPRPIDGDGDATATTDMGAYEYVPSLPPVGGSIIPTDKTGLVMPWVIAAALVVVLGVSLAVWNRKRGGARASGRS